MTQHQMCVLGRASLVVLTRPPLVLLRERDKSPSVRTGEQRKAVTAYYMYLRSTWCRYLPS